jgi:outer membrane receptor protein involved in Fe transport
MINAYPFFRSICIVSLFLFLYFNSFAQNFPVSGKIINAEGQPLAGVTIQVKGSNAKALTNPDGTFRINVPSSSSVLVASYVGFAEQQIPVNNQSQLSVTMTPQNISLQDVVVVGYGTKRRGDVTGAISTVSSEKIKSVPVTNVTQALQGRVAGVDANMSSFRPGAGATIRIRGNRSLGATNEPLYVVDGIPQSYSIDDLNPLDIESMDVLKDASATAIYGVIPD